MLNLTHKLQHHLSPQNWDWLLKIGAIANNLHLPLYLVGGIVRDIFLGQSSPDLDLVIEGDAITLATEVHQQWGGVLTTHNQFGTANWQPTADASFDIDFVTARSETYRHPAALPDVTPSTIAADLLRRDFTINAMAIRLDGAHLGQLLDPHSGRADLNNGQLRVLHPKSFIDDPTRIWRGIRFEQRLDFAFAPDTHKLLPHAYPYLSHLSADRVRHELELVLQEKSPIPTLSRLHELSIFTAVTPHLRWNKVIASRWLQLEKNRSTPLGQLAQEQRPFSEIRLLFWLVQHPTTQIEEITHHLNLSRKLVKLGHLASDLHEQLASNPWPTDMKPSAIARQLAHVSQSPAAGFTAVAHIPPHHQIYKWVTNYYASWRHITPHTTGRTLRQYHLSPGPIYREILDQLTAAWLDGSIQTETEEQTLLLDILQTYE